MKLIFDPKSISSKLLLPKMSILETLTNLMKIDNALKDDRFKDYHPLLQVASLLLHELAFPAYMRKPVSVSEKGIVIHLVDYKYRDLSIEFQLTEVNSCTGIMRSHDEALVTVFHLDSNMEMFLEHVEKFRPQIEWDSDKE